MRSELQHRFTHFFVDEFQDTDPLQAEILLLLAADDPAETDWRAARPISGKLFLVGDPKQSIYRFRRADVALYEQVKKRLLARRRGTPSSHHQLSRSSLDSVVRQCARLLRPWRLARTAARPPMCHSSRRDRKSQGGRRSSPCRFRGPMGTTARSSTGESMKSFPDAVGAFIDWLVNESGWTVEEDGKCGRRSGHAISAILFRRFRNFRRDVTRAYVRALEARRIPHVLVGGRSFHDREEIIALRNALTAIEWPDDELRVFATLRGPFFALSDEALLAFRQYVDGDGALQTRRLHPMHAVDRAALDAAAHRGRRCARALAAGSMSGATTARSPRPSPCCWKPCVPMPASRFGRPASRRSPIARG